MRPKVSMPLSKNVTRISKAAEMTTSFQAPDPAKVRNICCIGAGPIGAGWTAGFLARGYSVTAYVHEPSEEASLRSLVETAWRSLESLGLAEGASLQHLRCTNDLAEAVDGADFIDQGAVRLVRNIDEVVGHIAPALVEHVHHVDLLLGQHSREVLGEAGLTAEEIDDLIAAGVVISAE